MTELEILVDDFIRLLLVFVFATAIAMIRVRTLMTLVKIYSIQSFLIFLISILLYLQELSTVFLILGILTLLSKVIFLPFYIERIVKRLKIKRDMKFEYLSPTQSMFLSLIILLVVYQLLYPDFSEFGLSGGFLLGAISGISLGFIGLIIIFTRKLAISDILGYLTMENGALLLSLTVADLPFIIEVLVVLELFMITLLAAILGFGIDSTVEEFHNSLIFRRIVRKKKDDAEI